MRRSGCGSRRSRTRRSPSVCCRWASKSPTRRQLASALACALRTSGSRRRASTAFARSDARLHDLRCPAWMGSTSAAPIRNHCTAIKLIDPVTTVGEFLNCCPRFITVSTQLNSTELFVSCRRHWMRLGGQSGALCCSCCAICTAWFRSAASSGPLAGTCHTSSTSLTCPHAPTFCR